MEDTIQGPVTDIFNEDTFAMKVIRLGKHNRREYDSEEIIHIEVIDAPRERALMGERSKRLLERKLKGKEVRCWVQSRDAYNRVVSHVEVL